MFINDLVDQENGDRRVYCMKLFQRTQKLNSPQLSLLKRSYDSNELF